VVVVPDRLVNIVCS